MDGHTCSGRLFLPRSPVPPDPCGRRGGRSWSLRCLNSWQSAQHHVWGHREPELRTGQQTKNPEKGCQEEICTLEGAKDCGLGAAGRKRLRRAQTRVKGKLWQPGARQKTPVCRTDAQAGDSRAHGPKATRRGGRWHGARTRVMSVSGERQNVLEKPAETTRPTGSPEVLSMTG